jgi:hypothetical protein
MDTSKTLHHGYTRVVYTLCIVVEGASMRRRVRVLALTAALGLGGVAVPTGMLVLSRAGPRCSVDRHYLDKSPDDLEPAATRAWRTARRAARQEGVTLCLNDGRRTVAQQQAEFDDYRRRLGSSKAAGEYVLPPERSMHVKGLAVDVQPRGSAAWLERTAGRYGWCRRYVNEPWHFEYNATYVVAGCPRLQAHP